MNCREATLETSRQELALTTAGRRNDGGRSGGTGNLHRQEAEHDAPVHHDSYHSVHLSGGGEVSGGMGGETVLGAVGIESCG